MTLRPATLPAPAENRQAEGQVKASVDGIPFPYWKDRFGWKTTGARQDSVDGRAVRTVFYTDGKGRRVGYAIVSGQHAPKLPGGTVHWHDGTPYHLGYVNGTPVITWERDGHLCVVSGQGIDGKALLTLASWGDTA